MARPYYILEKDSLTKIIHSSDIQPYLDDGYINVRKATDEETKSAKEAESQIEIQTSAEVQISETKTIKTSQTSDIETNEKKITEVKQNKPKTIGTKRQSTKKP